MDKGQKVLFAMYKGKPSDEVKVSAEDLAVAKAEGYLFDYPKYESHADTLDRLKGTLAQIDPKAVADAFLFSLSTSSSMISQSFSSSAASAFAKRDLNSSFRSFSGSK